MRPYSLEPVISMRTYRFLPFAALVLLGACGSDTTSPVVDINSLVDQSAVSTYSSAALSAAVPGVTAAVTAPSSSTASCAYSTTNQRFECAPMTANGLTITRSYALLDASGHPLSTPNPAAVASIHTITDMTGTLSGMSTGTTGPSMTIDRHEDATMSQLQSATHLLNGTSTQKLGFATAASTYSSNETSTTSNLQLAKPTAAVHWPLGGTITTDRTMTITGLSTAMASHEVLSFDGTSVMTLTRTSLGVTSTCKIDLAKPATPPVCS